MLMVPTSGFGHFTATLLSYALSIISIQMEVERQAPLCASLLIVGL